MWQGQPVVRLRVMPQAELHNSTELPMVLELPGAPSITLDELSHSMLDWQPTGQRPSRLVLAQSSWAPTELQVRQYLRVFWKCHVAFI